MPIYEYRCKDCGTLFERTLTLVAHDGEPGDCPLFGFADLIDDDLRTRIVTHENRLDVNFRIGKNLRHLSQCSGSIFQRHR